MIATIRRLARDLLPGLVLPATIYFSLRRHAPTVVALAAASSVPALDALVRLARGRKPSPIGLGFIAVTALSVGLAIWFRSTLFILLRGAVTSGLIGIAFGLSAVIRRPLTRTLALRFSTERPEARRRLAERWRHPKALRVFCVLSVGWGTLLLLSGAQQAGLALTVSPGTVVAVEGPVQAAATALGVLMSVLYVRRHHLRSPELALLPRPA